MTNERTVKFLNYSLNVYQLLFFGVVLCYVITLLITFRDYGITIDEPSHAYYGKHIVHWYLSGFEEDDFLNAGNMLFYGGLFDTLVHPLTVISPFDIHDTRHLCNALVGLLGIVATYKLGAYLGSPLTGLLAALFLIFTPRFYGHSFNNPKDIPFAVCYIWGLYYLIQSVAELPDLSGKTLLKTAVAIGLTMAVRVGGFILLFYMGLVFFVRYVQLGWQTKPIRHQVLVWGKQYVFQVLSIALIAYVLMLLFWPRALIDPFVYPFHVLRVFSNFTYYVTTFFEGAEITWIEIPWYYVPKWLSMIVPEFVFVGLLLGVVWCVMRRERMGFNGVSLKWYLLVFASLFPPMYAVAIGSPLGDGLRHFLFIYPSVAILSSSGVTAFVRYVESIWIRRCVVGVMGMLMLMVVWDMVRLHPNQYIYFNRLVAGGLAEASKGYQTDYWENSYKQGVKWLDIHYQPKLGRRLRVGGASDNVQYLLDASRYEFVPVPEPELMDVYMSTTRADGHRMVPGEIIKTIDQDGVPLLYMIRPDSTYNNDPFFIDHVDRLIKLAWRYDKNNDLESAVAAYEEIIDSGYPSVVIYNNLSENYIRLGNYNKGEYFARKAIELNVDDAKAHLRLGMALVYQNRQKEAEGSFQKALALAPDMVIIYRNYGALLVALKRWDEVESLSKKAFEIDPLDEQILYFLAQSQRHQGKLEEAYQSIARSISVSSLNAKYQAEYINIGTSFFIKNHFDRALEIYEKIIQLNPDIPIVHFNSGIVLSKLGRDKEAAGAFRKVIELNPEDRDALIKFGNLSEKLNRYRDAVWAYEKLLPFFSENQELRKRIQLLEQQM